MTAITMPARLPATGMDLGVVLLRALQMHLELGCRLVFSGHVDAPTLERAVRLSLDAEPVLGCALETNFFTGWWRRREDLDSQQPLLEIIKTQDSDAQWYCFVGGTIDDRGPQTAATLVQTDDHDEIFIRLSHVAADGQGVKAYAYLLSDIYCNLVRDPGYIAHPRHGERPCVADAASTLTEQELRTAPKEPRTRGEFWVIPNACMTGSGRSVREHTFPPQEFAVIRDYGRSRDASVHDMLLTALLRATTRNFPTPHDKEMALTFSVDYRRYLDQRSADRVANVSSSINTAVACHEVDTFDDTLNRVRARTDEVRRALWGVRGVAKLEGMTGRALVPLRWVMGGLARRNATKGLANAFLSNFGVLEEERLVFGELTPAAAVMFGPAPWGSGQLTSVSTYKDHLTISMGFCEGDQEAAQVESVLQAMVEELRLGSEGYARLSQSV